MDLLRAHKTDPVKQLLRKSDIALSLVPAGCTGLVQLLDVSINRPFKDLLKQAIDDEWDRRDLARDDIEGDSAVGEMRVMMTRCVAEAWETFCRERREVVIRSFHELGLSLPLNGSCDGELSIKGLETPMLMNSLKDWKTRGAASQDEQDITESGSDSEGASDTDTDEDLSVNNLASQEDCLSNSVSPETGLNMSRRGRATRQRGRPQGRP